GQLPLLRAAGLPLPYVGAVARVRGVKHATVGRPRQIKVTARAGSDLRDAVERHFRRDPDVGERLPLDGHYRARVGSQAEALVIAQIAGQLARRALGGKRPELRE